MNNTSEDYLFTFLKVRNHYNANALAMNVIPTLQTNYTTFNAEVDTYMLELANSTADTSGYAMNKEGKRNDLTQRALQISNSLTAYYITIDDDKGRKLADYPSSYFTLASAEDLIARCLALHNLADSVGVLLDPFNVSVAQITEFKTALDEFVAANPEGSLAIDNRKVSAAKAEETRLRIMDLLVNKIDILVRVFEVSNSFLYNTYLEARALDVAGTPTSPDYVGTLTPGIISMVVDIPYVAGRSFKIKNSGGDFLNACLSNNPLLFQGATLVVNGGSTNTWLSSTFNPDSSANFLLLQNNSPLPMDYEVTIVE